MKNLIKGAILVMLITIGIPSQSKDLTPGTANTKAKGTLDEAQVNKLMNRLEEIRLMDKDNITRSQKVQLRKEVKAIKKTMGSGVYLSVGAIIIILLLIILL